MINNLLENKANLEETLEKISEDIKSRMEVAKLGRINDVIVWWFMLLSYVGTEPCVTCLTCLGSNLTGRCHKVVGLLRHDKMT